MTILEHELQKYSLWMDELNKKRNEFGESSAEFKSSEEKLHVLVSKQDQLFRGTQAF